MSRLVPKLVINEKKQVCMQVSLGPYTATFPLPDELAGKSEEEIKPFFDLMVPEMIKGLIEMRKKEQRKFNRKAKCSSGTTSQQPESEARILPLPQKP